MPAGSTDANGVYQYGSSDTVATFHGLLNIAGAVLSATVGAMKTRLTSLEASRNKPTLFVAVTDAARNSQWGTPATAGTRRALQDLGAQTTRPDKGWTEQYFAGLTDGGTNTAGATTPGWYPITHPLCAMTVTVAGQVAVGAFNVLGSLGATAGGTYVEVSDRCGWHNPASNQPRITPTVAGLYRARATHRWAPGATDSRGVQINKNGTLVRQNRVTPVGTTDFSLTMETNLVMNGTTDYVEFLTWQNGGTLDFVSDVLVEYIGPA